jgi:lipopolysaccharide export LptBFGC system permease protein LptF
MIYHEGVPNLLLYNGNRQEFDEETQKLSILFFDQTSVSLKPSKKIVTPRGRKMYEMNISELLDSAVSDKSQAKRLYAEISQRILMPWYALTFSCIGTIFLLLKSFTRTFQVSSVLYSIGAVIGIYVLTLLLLNLGARSWIALGGAYMLQCMTIIASFYLLMRNRS